MDAYAQYVESQTRDVRDAVVTDGFLHPLIGETLLESEVLIALLRRLTKLQFANLGADEQAYVLEALPQSLGKFAHHPVKQEAYLAARAKLIRDFAPRG